jgi:cytochrome P450
MHGTIDLAADPYQEAARERAYSIPLEDIDVGHPELFRTNSFWPYFDRLRKEDPVHYCKDSLFGPYWSVTKYNDIMDIETNHAVFSSAASLGGITIRDIAPDLRRESFIAMDQPRHSAQRKTVAPMFTPTHLDQLAILIRILAQRVDAARQRVAGGVVAADDQQDQIAEEILRVHVAGGVAVRHHRQQVALRRLADALLPEPGEIGRALHHLGLAFVL